MNKPRISILIPAAGGSQRLGRAKQLVSHQGRTLIRRAVDIAESLAPLEIIVVTGSSAEAVSKEIKQTAAECIHNPDWSNGMGCSIAIGAQAINPASQGLMVLLCDQWRVQKTDLQSMLDLWLDDPSRIVCAEYGGHIGPPVIFPGSCFAAINDLQGSRGAQSVLEANPKLVRRVAMDNAAFDLDTPAQLDELGIE